MKWLATFKFGANKGEIVEEASEPLKNLGVAFWVVKETLYLYEEHSSDLLANALEKAIFLLNEKEPRVTEARKLLSAAIAEHLGRHQRRINYE
jgi:hypothetical protein